METAQIRAEVERLVNELKDLETKRQALDSKIVPKRQELEHWSGILNLRQVGNGNGVPSPDVPPRTKAAEDSSPTASDEQPQEYGAKARAMREFILSKNGAGVTMQELIEAARKISPHAAFVYQFVNRQRRAKPPKLEKRGKRFYATESLTPD